MHSFDFFSVPPHTFIFQKESNKTNFGGFCCVLYMIVMLCISLLYLIDFFINDKYEIQYAEIKNTTTYNQRRELNNDSDLNPNINITLQLYDFNGKKLSDRFVLLDIKNDYTKIERGKKIERRVTNAEFGIFYDCNSDNIDDCKRDVKDTTFLNYYIQIIYSGFELNHDQSIPFHKNESTNFEEIYEFFFNYILVRNLYWENIKYKEEKGISRLWDKMIGKNNSYIGGYIKSSESYIADNYGYYLNKTNEYDKTYILIGLIFFNNEHEQYIEYRRKKIELLDVLSVIGALFSSVKFVFFFIFSYYSKNFDSYKIIEKILYDNIKNRISINGNKKLNMKEIELTQDFNKSSSINDFDSNEKNNLIKDVFNEPSPLMDNFSNDNRLISNELYNNADNINDSDFEVVDRDKYKNLKKFRFIHFFLNNLHLKCLNHFKQQEILYLCNEILLKYLSIDSIMYNQMIFENLLKDYKWNDPKLNNLDNNDLLTKLKNLL